MKTTLLVVCVLCTSAAFAQYYGSISSTPQVPQWPSHPAQATYAPMLRETSILSGTSYASADGERPASDFPQPDPVSLGTVARELKKEHDQVKKSRVVWINQ